MSMRRLACIIICTASCALALPRGRALALSAGAVGFEPLAVRLIGVTSRTLAPQKRSQTFAPQRNRALALRGGGRAFTELTPLLLEPLAVRGGGAAAARDYEYSGNRTWIDKTIS